MTVTASYDTEQLLLATGFHPNTARTFSGFEHSAVRGELLKQDLQAWLPREDQARRTEMLVMAMSDRFGSRQKPETSRWSANATEPTDH